MGTHAMKQDLVLFIAVLQHLTSDTATAFGGGNTVFRRQVVNGRGGGRRVHGVDFGGFQPDAQHQNYHRSRVVHPSQRPRQTEWTPIVTPDDAAATVVVRDPTAARQRHAVAYVTLPTTASTVVATNPVTANGVYGDGSRRPYGYGDDIYYYQHVDTDYSKNRYSQNSVNGGDQTDQARANNQNDMSLVSKTSRNYRNTYAIAGEEKNVSSSHAADVKHDEPLRISYYYPGFENDQRHLRVVSKTHSVDGQMSKQENQNLNIDVATKSHYGDYQNGNAEAVVYENNSERPRNNNDLNFDGDRGHDLAVVAEYDQRPRTHDTVDGENQRRPNRDEKPVEMKNNSTDNSYGRNAVEEGNVSVDADSSSDDHTRHEEREQRQPSAVGHVTAAERPLASVDGLVRNRLGQNLYAHVDATDKNERRYGEGNGKNNYYYYSYDGRENDVKSYDADESIVQNHRESMTPLSVQRKEIERLHRPSTTAAAAEMTVTTTARPRQRRRKVQSSVRQTRRPSVDDQNAVRNDYDDRHAAAAGTSSPSGETLVAGQRQTATEADEKQPARGYGFGYAVLDEYAGTDFGQWERREPGRDGAVTGQYRVRLPDGRTQTVRYTVDSDTGYMATVTYEGVQHHPPPPPDGPYDTAAAVEIVPSSG